MNKIKIALLLIAFAGVSHLTIAQAQVAVGIKGGLNFAKLDVKGSASDNYEGRTGYHAGAFALVKVGMIGVQPEIIFSRQGYDYKDVNTQNVEANFDYINIPVIAKLYLPLGLNIQAGPQFGFLSKAEAEVFVTNASQSQTVDVKNLYKGSDVSLGLGAGWDLPFGLTVDARYNLGLSKINDNNNAPESKNRVFQVSLGYKLFKFGK
jgi:Outer membrane protein beta-barrel domain